MSRSVRKIIIAVLALFALYGMRRAVRDFFSQPDSGKMEDFFGDLLFASIFLLLIYVQVKKLINPR